MKTADIVFVMHHDSRLSKVIAWFMSSRWSHSAVIVETGALRTYLCETSDFEVTLGLLERYTSDRNVEMEIWQAELNDETRRAVLERCLQNVGMIYGYFQLLSFAVRFLLSRIGIDISNFIRQGILCNQNVLSGYTASPGAPFYGFDYKSIQTEEFYQMVKTSGKFSLVYSKAKGN